MSTISGTGKLDMLAITPILVLIRGQGYSTYRYRYQYGSMPYMLVIWTEPCNINGIVPASTGIAADVPLSRH